MKTIYTELRQPGDAEGSRRPVRTHSSSVLAFPRSAEYACSLQGFRRAHGPDFWVSLGAVLCALLTVACLAWTGDKPAPGIAACTTDTECGCTVDCLEPAPH